MKRTADQMTNEELEQYGVHYEMQPFYDAETMQLSEPKKIFYIYPGKRVTVFEANAHILRQQVAAKRAERSAFEAGVDEGFKDFAAKREAQILSELGY